MIRALSHCTAKSWTFAAKRVNIPRYHSSFQNNQRSSIGIRLMSSSSSSFASVDGGSDGISSSLPVAPAPPSSLLTYLRTRMIWGLGTWKQPSEDHRTASIEDAATTIVNFLLTTHYYQDNLPKKTADEEEPVQTSSEGVKKATSKERNKRLMDFGLTFAKALYANPGHLNNLLSHTNPEVMQSTLSEVMVNYQRYIEKNKAVFLHINTHHENLGKKSWDTAVQDERSLQTYAGAAKAMGEKQWVRDGNAWMENFAVSFFRRNGARKHYIRMTFPQSSGQGQGLGQELKKGVTQGLGSEPGSGADLGSGVGDWSASYAASLPRDLMLPETFSSSSSSSESSSSLTSSISSSLISSSEPRKIRLVDVGSCYNPISHSASAAAFEVTALDLCPTDPSVLQCDFLALEIGSQGSFPLIVQPNNNHNNNNTNNNNNNNNNNDSNSISNNKNDSMTSTSSPVISSSLLRLPAASYDVVTMSLVLNYLPTPTQREGQW